MSGEWGNEATRMRSGESGDEAAQMRNRKDGGIRRRKRKIAGVASLQYLALRWADIYIIVLLYSVHVLCGIFVAFAGGPGRCSQTRGASPPRRAAQRWCIACVVAYLQVSPDSISRLIPDLEQSLSGSLRGLGVLLCSFSLCSCVEWSYGECQNLLWTSKVLWYKPDLFRARQRPVRETSFCDKRVQRVIGPCLVSCVRRSVFSVLQVLAASMTCRVNR